MQLPRIDVYRAKTRLHALYRLYTLDQEEIDRFLGSYVLFDGDWKVANGKREEQIVDYYNVLNHLCAVGNVEKMYIPPVRDPGVGLVDNQILFERKMMEDIGARGGARVLDIGCGRGRVASHVARHTGAHVTGLNIDPGQLENARAYVQRERLADRCDFVRGSLNDPMPFADASFDGAYQIQAFTYAKDKHAVCAELFRVLRPGARFSYLDWVLLPPFDPNDPEHVDLVNRSGPAIGAVDNPTVDEITDALEGAGFEVLLSENASIGGRQSPLITGERRHFGLVRKLVAAGVKSRLIPAYFPTLFNRLKQDVDAFVAADELGISTTSYQIVCRKPA